MHVLFQLYSTLPMVLQTNMLYYPHSQMSLFPSVMIFFYRISFFFILYNFSYVHSSTLSVPALEQLVANSNDNK
jgi:hypothetical protein